MKKDTDQKVVEQEHFLTKEGFRDYLRAQARQALAEVIEQEVQSLCGRHYKPDKDSRYRRAGSAPSYVMTEAKREAMARPRVRRETVEGSEEVPLKSWKLAQSPDEWEAAMMRATLCGVSTRDVAALRESELAGESSSSLSRLWQRKSAELVTEMQESDLSGFELTIIMLDAVVLGSGLVATVALGIDSGGNKQVLGFRVGSSENQEVCRDLLSALQRRGLRAPEDRYLLGVLDGSAALKNALLEVYPRTLIQRCLVHKERNLRGYLSTRHWAELTRLFKRLRKSQGKETAGEALRQLEAFLKGTNAQAQASLTEAEGELLTLLDLELPNTLNVSLLSTNNIENVFKNLRRHIGRVSRWRENTDQADRWLASGLLLASKGFRRIGGYAELPHLIKALERKMAEFKNEAA